MIRLQLGRGQAIRCDELLQMSKQLHGHRTYFLPGGAFRIGCEKCSNIKHAKSKFNFQNNVIHTVAS